MNTGSLPYSYHTFLFPFIWKTEGNEKIEMFISQLDNRHWKEQEYGKKDVFPKNSKEEYTPDYAVYQYFTEPARYLIFGMGKDSYMRLFQYKYYDKSWGRYEEGTQVGYYVITKRDEVFRLVINDIKLNIYDSGTAILAFELENWDARYIEKVNLINEYGRRVRFPFLSFGKTVLTADKIEIVIKTGEKEECIVSEDYLTTSEMLVRYFPHYRDYRMSPQYIMRPITFILNGDETNQRKRHITSNPNKGGFKIRSLIDDRMFVCCAITDSSFVDYVRGDYQDGMYRYIRDCDESHLEFDKNVNYVRHTASNDLYRLLFIEESCTCDSGVMRKEILQRCVYDRFINWGTIHGVSHHAILCITSVEHVIDAFLTEYVEIAKIALLQRGTISKLSADAARIADKIESGVISGFKDIETLQNAYVKSQSRILLFEVTTQEQGVEFFDMLRNELYIKENKRDLDEQMNNLREVANIRSNNLEHEADKRLDKKLAVLSIIALPISVFETLMLLFNPDDCCIKTVIFILSALTVFIPLYFFFWRKKAKELDS